MILYLFLNCIISYCMSYIGGGGGSGGHGAAEKKSKEY